MNEILKTELFSILTETSFVANSKMENAYADFINRIKSFVQSETDFSEIFRALNLTRIEFKTLQAKFLCEQGEKCA